MEWWLIVWFIVGIPSAVLSLYVVPDQPIMALSLGFLFGPFGVIVALLVSIRRAIEEQGEGPESTTATHETDLPPIQHAPALTEKAQQEQFQTMLKSPVHRVPQPPAPPTSGRQAVPRHGPPSHD
jgi:hypothetical protein